MIETLNPFLSFNQSTNFLCSTEHSNLFECSGFYFLILFGYLVGSLSPGYFFGRIVKRIDIRKYGNENTGAANTYRIVGPFYGVITAFVDFLKAPIAYLISISFLDPNLAIIIGLFAVIGHIFPFYLGFRGGRGVASLYGLSIAALFFNQSIYVLILAVASIWYYFVISPRQEIRNIFQEAPLRRFLKLAGLLLPIGYIWLSRLFFVRVLTILLVISLIIDILRFLFPRFNQRYLKLKSIAKQKELKTFSGYTVFLISALLLFLVFPKEIAVLSLTLFIIGDIAAPFAGLWFLPKRMFSEKTWGGFVLVFVFTVFAGYFLKFLTPLSITLEMILAGAFLTALLDQFSFLLDDNILVPLGTAIGLSFLV